VLSSVKGLQEECRRAAVELPEGCRRASGGLPEGCRRAAVK